MKSEFTKGEWRADNGESDLWGIFQKEDCKAIAYLCEPDGTLLRENEAEANARLIAQAPKLYEMCLCALGVMATLDQNKGWVKEISDKIQQAIASVEGKC